MKNTIFSTLNKIVFFVGRTFLGSHHDYSMLKEEFPPEHPWFELICILADLGYQGIQKDYQGDDIHIPHKKPRKSKNNPAPQLLPEQKEENRALSQVRVLVEHSIGGMKRFQILVQAFRNRKDGFADVVVGLTAGLWNFLSPSPEAIECLRG